MKNEKYFKSFKNFMDIFIELEKDELIKEYVAGIEIGNVLEIDYKIICSNGFRCINNDASTKIFEKVNKVINKYFEVYNRDFRFHIKAGRFAYYSNPIRSVHMFSADEKSMADLANYLGVQVAKKIRKDKDKDIYPVLINLYYKNYNIFSLFNQ